MNDDLAQRVAGELERANSVTLQLEPLSFIQLVALVQLAMRVPNVPRSDFVLGLDVVTAACMHFRGFPAVLDLIERGNDPAHDVPAPDALELGQLWDVIAYSEQSAICELSVFSVLPDSLQGRRWETLNNDERESISQGVRRLVLLAARVRP